MSGGFSHRRIFFAAVEMSLQASGVVVRRHDYTAAHVVVLECAVTGKIPMCTPTGLSRALLEDFLLTAFAGGAVAV